MPTWLFRSISNLFKCCQVIAESYWMHWFLMKVQHPVLMSDHVENHQGAVDSLHSAHNIRLNKKLHFTYNIHRCLLNSNLTWYIVAHYQSDFRPMRILCHRGLCCLLKSVVQGCRIMEIDFRYIPILRVICSEMWTCFLFYCNPSLRSVSTRQGFSR